MDDHKNFAISTVAIAPSPSLSGNSLVIKAGTGSSFPTAPFNATIWPVNEIPTSTNATIVRVTVKSSDTLTFTRSQESSINRAIIVGDQICAGITAKTLTDIETAIPTGSTLVTLAGPQTITGQKTITSPLFIGTLDGWIGALDVFTFATSDQIGGGLQNSTCWGTITTPGDQTDKYYAGMKFKFNQTTDKYSFITKVSYDAGSGLTTLTLFLGTNYVLDNAGITLPFYSMVNPFGFDMNPDSWTIQVVSNSNRLKHSPTGGTWYNAESIDIPLGIWEVDFKALCGDNYSSGTGRGSGVTLSTEADSETNPDWTTYIYTYETNPMIHHIMYPQILVADSAGSYYLNYQPSSSTGGTNDIGIWGALYRTIIRARCAYL